MNFNYSKKKHLAIVYNLSILTKLLRPFRELHILLKWEMAIVNYKMIKILVDLSFVLVRNVKVIQAVKAMQSYV